MPSSSWPAFFEHREGLDHSFADASEMALADPSPDHPDPAVTAVFSKAAGDPATSQSRPPGPAAQETTATAKPTDVADLPEAIAALLPAARIARDELHRDGRVVTRDALVAHLRRHGHSIRNSSITPLLNNLRLEAGSAITCGQEPASRAA